VFEFELLPELPFRAPVELEEPLVVGAWARVGKLVGGVATGSWTTTGVVVWAAVECCVCDAAGEASVAGGE
jgi:hypothetical protein